MSRHRDAPDDFQPMLAGEAADPIEVAHRLRRVASLQAHVAASLKT